VVFWILFLAITKKTRITDVVYNASSNELVRTKTLVKNCIVVIDASPFRLWYEAHYAMPLIKKKGAKQVCQYLTLITCYKPLSLSCTKVISSYKIHIFCIFPEI